MLVLPAIAGEATTTGGGATAPPVCGRDAGAGVRAALVGEVIHSKAGMMHRQRRIPASAIGTVVDLLAWRALAAGALWHLGRELAAGACCGWACRCVGLPLVGAKGCVAPGWRAIVAETSSHRASRTTRGSSA